MAKNKIGCEIKASKDGLWLSTPKIDGKEYCINLSSYESKRFVNEVWQKLYNKHTEQMQKEKATAKAIFVVIDESRPPNIYFIDIQKDGCEQIKIGERIKGPDGLTFIKITEMDIQKI